MVLELTAEWVSAIAGVVAAIAAIVAAGGLIFTARQLKQGAKQLELAKIQIVADHDRSKKELSISLMREWSNSLTLQDGSARKIVEQLSLEDCMKIIKNEALTLPSSFKSKIITALSIDENDGQSLEADKDGNFVLGEQLVAKLDGIIISYLNRLESILMSWHLGVADKEIIEQQFAYLYKPKDKHRAVETFRIAKGGLLAFPIIDKFIIKLKKNQERK